MLKLHELQEQRTSAVTNMRALADLAENEKRDLTVAEEKTFGDLKTSIADLDKKIGRAQTLADAERSAPAIVHGRLGDGQYEERARDFSIVKSLRASLPRDLGGGDVDIGFEREISSEVVRRSGRKFEGIAVLDQVFLQERRTLLVGSSAADLVPPGHRDDLFINVLRSKLIVAQRGGTYLDGLVGSPIDIPRQTGSSTAQWVAEDGSLSETDASFDDVTFTPKTVGAVTSMSRRTILNTSPPIEQLVRNDLASVLASAIDAKALIGDGSSNTPTGVVHATGANDLTSVTGPTWDEVLQFIAMVDADNALDGSLGWAANPYVVKKLRSTLVAASTDSRMIMEGPNQLAGYPASSTSALPGVAGMSPDDTSYLIFGDWSQLLIGSWTGVDLLANPFETTAYLKGRVLLRAMKDCDVQVRHGEAFAYSNAITIA